MLLRVSGCEMAGGPSFSLFSHPRHCTGTSFISIFSSNYILLSSSLKFIANFAKLLTCSILLNFYEKSMEFHPTEALSLMPLSGVSEAYLPPDLMREIGTARSFHLAGQGAINRKRSYFSKIRHFKKCHLVKMSLKRQAKEHVFNHLSFLLVFSSHRSPPE